MNKHNNDIYDKVFFRGSSHFAQNVNKMFFRDSSHFAQNVNNKMVFSGVPGILHKMLIIKLFFEVPGILHQNC